MSGAQRRSAPGSRGWLAAAAGVLVLVSGCGLAWRTPGPAATGEDAGITVRDVQVESAGEHRAVLVHLSQRPSQLRYGEQRNPPAIMIDAWGPPGDFDIPERTLAQQDALVEQVRVSRRDGRVRIAIDMRGSGVPPFRVYEMADWIMVRIQGPGL